MAYLYNKFAKGVENNVSGTQMTWWKANFNMPTPDVYDNKTNWVLGSGPFIYHGTATAFDLTGFNNGWELLVSISGFHREDGEGTGNTHTLKQSWRTPINDIIFEAESNFTYEITAAGTWLETQLGSNQGVAPWEISTNGTYSCIVSVSGPDINISQTYSFTITNHPGFSGYETPGYFWVESTDLCYTGVNGFIHRITGVAGTSVGVSSAGAIWVDETYNGILYIDQLGVKRTPQWSLLQFASYWSNSASYAVSGQTPGYIYTDNEFGGTHLGVILQDGNKYLIGDGNYPYQDPY